MPPIGFDFMIQPMSKPTPSRKPIAPRAAIFDLDGTLIDSLRDVAESANACMTLLGLPEIPLDQYRYLVGEGIPRLCERAIGDAHPLLVARLADLTRSQYRLRLLRWTQPYPGIREAVDRLVSRGLTVAVLSNKPDDMTKCIVRELWPDRPFSMVCGMTAPELRKPNPHAALEICRQLGIEPRETWFVGDTPIDVATAKSAGCISIAVTWGFRERELLEQAGAEFIIDHPAELIALAESRLPKQRLQDIP
jgi:phosphoglycolate phosphatase